MGIKLSDLRAKLPDDKAGEWKAWILERAVPEQETAIVLRDELAERLGIKTTSVHKPLSNFLNGHTHEVAQWLHDGPTDKAHELCKVMGGGETPADLWEHFISLMPRVGGGLNVDVLDHLGLEVEFSEPSQFLHSLKGWLDALDVRVELPTPPEEPRLSWTTFVEYLEELSSSLQALDRPPQLEIELATWSGDRFGRAAREMHLPSDLAKQRLSSVPAAELLLVEPEPGEHDAEHLVKLPAPIHPIDRDDLEAWLERLEELGLLSSVERTRAFDFFKAASVESINKLSCTHLLYALEDASKGPLEYAQRVFQRRRAEWLRRDLRANSAPRAEEWLRDTRDFFLRWLETAGTLRGDVDRGQLDWILDVAASRTDQVSRDSLEQGLEAFLRANDLDDLAELRKMAVKLLPNKLKSALQGPNFIKIGPRSTLSKDLRTLGELEVPLYLEPAHLNVIDINASEELIIDAVRLAPEEHLDSWCEAAIAVKGLEQPRALYAVLQGLSERSTLPRQVDPILITRLWASAVWASLFCLHSYVGHEPDHHGYSVAQRASESLREVLPLLEDADGPLAALEALVDEQIKSAVERWRSSAPALSEEEAGDHLTRLAPFQVRFADSRLSMVSVIEGQSCRIIEGEHDKRGTEKAAGRSPAAFAIRRAAYRRAPTGQTRAAWRRDIR